jgi:hypothetical protein
MHLVVLGLVRCESSRNLIEEGMDARNCVSDCFRACESACHAQRAKRCRSHPRQCVYRMYDYLLEVGYSGNVGIINVQLGWDPLDKLKIERRRWRCTRR